MARKREEIISNSKNKPDDPDSKVEIKGADGQIILGQEAEPLPSDFTVLNILNSKNVFADANIEPDDQWDLLISHDGEEFPSSGGDGDGGGDGVGGIEGGLGDGGGFPSPKLPLPKP